MMSVIISLYSCYACFFSFLAKLDMLITIIGIITMGTCILGTIFGIESVIIKQNFSFH